MRATVYSYRCECGNTTASIEILTGFYVICGRKGCEKTLQLVGSREVKHDDQQEINICKRSLTMTNHFCFDETSPLPCRVAVSGYDGGAYAYASHTEVREYADTTIGYAWTREEFETLVAAAEIEAAARNED